MNKPRPLPPVETSFAPLLEDNGSVSAEYVEAICRLIKYYIEDFVHGSEVDISGCGVAARIYEKIEQMRCDNSY